MSFTTDPSDNIVRSPLKAMKYPDISVAEYLAQSLIKQNSNNIALIDPQSGHKLTYGALHQHAQKFASALLSLGLTKSDLVLFISDNCLEYCIAMFATIYLGITLTQAKPANGAFEVSEQINDSGATVLIFGANQVNVIKKVVEFEEYSVNIKQIKVLVELGNGQFDGWLKNHKVTTGKLMFSYAEVFQMGQDGPLKSIPYFQVNSLDRDHCMICYTSGTTGKSKGAILSNRSFLATLLNWKCPSDYAGLKSAMPFPIGHFSGTIFVPRALAAGMTVVLFATADVDTIVKAINQYRIEHFIFPASAATPLALTDYSEQYDLSCLKICTYAGAKISGHLLETIKSRYNVEMWELYGATEFAGSVGTIDVKYATGQFKPGNLGQVLPNVEMKIIDLRTGAALPSNEAGEICFRGMPCFIGYLNNEKETGNTVDADGWYHSGDVGYYDENGCLFTSDRIKELIKYKIWSVFPTEIEDFLQRHPTVWSVCVVGVPHALDGYWIRAYVQLAEGKIVTEQELIDYVKENMGIQKQLHAGIKFIAKMPQTAIGKIDRQYFKKLVNEELLD